METPLNAREFLKRYHLPQLVRINHQQLTTDGGHQESEVALGSNLHLQSLLRPQQVDGESPASSAASALSAGHGSNTSISSSFVALRASELPASRICQSSHWTYSQHKLPQPTFTRSGPRSLLCTVGDDNDGDHSPSHSDDNNSSTNQFCSISAWSSAQVNQMLEKQQLTVRVPRASLIGAPQVIRSGSPSARPAAIRSNVLRTGKGSGGGGGSGPEASKSVASSRVQPVDEAVPEAMVAQDSIRLTPPSKRPTLSKLELNQPFLLYKAYKKLELCAYLMDPKNELNEKSGDPIYFPQNYPGWFTINDTSQEPRKPLEDIDQVCRSQAQVFLTRDELIAYQLPKKLSHLTKLKNNQLLALPLAINLDLAASGNGSGNSSGGAGNRHWQDAASGGGGGGGGVGSVGGNKSSPKENISDIKQVVIKAGQALKVCAIYEDVLPLIEGGKQQFQPQKLKHQKQAAAAAAAAARQQQPSLDAFSLEQHYQVAPPAPIIYQQQQQQHFYHSLAENSHHQYQVREKKTRRLLKLRNQNNSNNNNGGGCNKRQQVDFRQTGICCAPSALHYQEPQVSTAAYAVGGHLPRLASSKLLGQKALKARGQQKLQQQQQSQQHQAQQQQVGQRYARCVLLNQSSVDKLTDCSSRSVRGEQVAAPEKTTSDSHDEDEEVEVLIPIDQRGRFYLCATNQSLMSEPYHYLCLAASHQASNMVFKLSQIVYLLNFSRRLPPQRSSRMSQDSIQCATSQMPRASIIKLPLSVRLVFGPRPANFSPSMFGSSSTMESYFRQEDNVAGHSVSCPYNKGFASSSETQPLDTSSGSICSCGPRLEPTADGSDSYGFFSAALCIERVIRRDVLLACTIKRDPLVHLDLYTNKPSVASHRATGTTTAAMLLASDRSSRLLTLREPIQSKQLSSLERHQADKAASKTSGKSSFSRLRACRSLISLNGRRNKTRPHIPSSMITCSTDPSGAEASAGTGAQNSRHQQTLRDHSAGEAIVMVEFDCNENELQFVRTFVENSLPTSSIPDLVIKRMEFCHKNSALWERQLKLSYRSLSQDFDSCLRQMEQNRRLRSTTLSSFAYVDNVDLISQAHQKRVGGRMSDSVLSLHHHQHQQQQQQHQEQQLLLKATTNRLGSSKNSPQTSTTTNSVHSSTSSSTSRSSSGVSSAGDQQQRHKSLRSTTDGNKSGATNSLTSSASTSTSVPLRAPAPTSRLLRLVHRMLPRFSQPSKASADQGSYLQHTETIDELTDHFRKQMDLDEQQQADEATAEADSHTMMNAQKIHRKLMTGSVHHLASGARSLPPARDEDTMQSSSKDSSGGASSGTGNMRDSCGQQSNEDEDEDDRDQDHDHDSHLYESLERLNAGLKKPAAARAGQEPSDCGQSRRRSQQVAQSGPPQTGRSLLGQTRAADKPRRLPGLGQSIEMLVGARLSSMRPGQQQPATNRVEERDAIRSNSNNQHLRPQISKADSHNDYLGEYVGDELDNEGGGGGEWWRSGRAGKEATKGDKSRWISVFPNELDGGPEADQCGGQSPGWQRRATNRLRDLGTMEPISIEHDEFISMACDEPASMLADSDADGQGEAGEEETIAHRSALNSSLPPLPVAGANLLVSHIDSSGSGQQEENIYVNLSRHSGRPLEAEEEEVGVHGNRRQHHYQPGRMERKLMKIRGRRSGTRSPCGWLQQQQPNSLVAGEPLAKLRPALRVGACDAAEWTRIDWGVKSRSSADSLAGPKQCERSKLLASELELTGAANKSTAAAAVLARSSSASFSSSSNDATEENSSSCSMSNSGDNSSQSSLDFSNPNTDAHYPATGPAQIKRTNSGSSNNNTKGSRVIPFKHQLGSGSCSGGGPGNQVSCGADAFSRVGREQLARTPSRSNKPQRGLATLDRSEPVSASQRD